MSKAVASRFVRPPACQDACRLMRPRGSTLASPFLAALKSATPTSKESRTDRMNLRFDVPPGAGRQAAYRFDAAHWACTISRLDDVNVRCSGELCCVRV